MHDGHFLLPGDPCGKPRMTRQDKWKQRPRVMRYRSWADVARQIVNGHPLWKRRLHRPTKLDVIATFAIPKSRQKTVKPDDWHTVTPDTDNILKAVGDALFENDQMIVDSTILKRWGILPQVTVTITTL